MPFIIGNETFEKLGAIGTLSNLLVYLTTVFNLKSITATTVINIFNGTTNFATLIGAYLSDTYFGRYKTLGFCTTASFMGLLVIQLTAAIAKLHPPSCGQDSEFCIGPTAGQMAFLLTGFGLLIVGAAGVRPCNLAFGADQFNPKTESGKKGVNSFFNCWAIGLGIPAILMLIAVALYFMGSYIYVKVKASGSPMTSVAQVLVVAVKKRRLKLPEEPWVSLFNYIHPNSINSKLNYTPQFRFLNKAAILTPNDKINTDGSASDSWKLCTIQQVEEVKCLIRVILIWSSCIIYYTAIVQQQTYVVFQAMQSDRRLRKIFQVPAASYIVFLMLRLTIFIPIYDWIIVPFLRRITGKEGGITILQRIGIGIFLSMLTMLVSAFVENHRRTTALTKPTIGNKARKGEISSMSGLWLIPQLTLAGLAEAYASVGQVEFYYKQFPENMRSIAGAVYYAGMACSSYFSGFLITIIHRRTANAATGNWLPEYLNKGRLDYFYYFIAALGVLDLGYFLVCANWYKYKNSEDVGIKIESMESEKGLA